MNWIIVDGFAQVYRAYYAFINLRTTSGVSSGSVYGFLTTLRSLKKRWPDFHIVVAWDSVPTRRKKIYADYKSNRNSMSDSFPLYDLRRILSCLNVTQAFAEGEEADDVIASLVEKNKDKLIYVYSPDKDLLQLVEDGKVVAVKPKTGKNEEKFFDEEAVRKEYGLSPSKISYYLAFRGDNSDNIPGVPRLPSKIIVDLLNKHGDPRSVYASLNNEKLTDFQRNSLIKNEYQVYLNSELTALRTDLEPMIIKGVSNNIGLDEVLSKYEIKSIDASKLINMFASESSFTMRKQPALRVQTLF